MKYHKLVRDKIPEIIDRKGDIALTRVAADEEYVQKLREKLAEDIQEFFEKWDQEEMADILEVLFALCDHKKFDRREIEHLRKKKQKERGGFKEKIILEEVIDR